MFDVVATQALVGCSPALQSGTFTVIGAGYGVLHTPLALQADPVTVQTVGPLAGAVHVVVGVDVV